MCSYGLDMKPMIEKLAVVARTALGWKETSKRDSNYRRACTRISWVISGLLILMLTITTPSARPNTISQASIAIVAAFFVLVSVGFFIQNVIVVLFLTGKTFQVDVRRLFIDTVTSATFSIIAMAWLHMFFGLVTDDVTRPIKAVTSIYFSIVTFTTLGYGDFSPSAALRIPSSVHALIGNLHLGAIIGVALMAASRKT